MKNLSLIAVINSNPYLLFRSEGKINEGKRTQSKTSRKEEGKYHFYSLGTHRLCNTNLIHGRLDGVYGILYGLK